MLFLTVFNLLNISCL